nr:MAG TPA: hypothetical protein [Caudoviricetes sp.]
MLPVFSDSVPTRGFVMRYPLTYDRRGLVRAVYYPSVQQQDCEGLINLFIRSSSGRTIFPIKKALRKKD